jgi:hypothetical protein
MRNCVPQWVCCVLASPRYLSLLISLLSIHYRHDINSNNGERNTGTDTHKHGIEDTHKHRVWERSIHTDRAQHNIH